MRLRSFFSPLLLSLLISAIALSCRTNDSSEQTVTQSIQMVSAPTFNADSAYAFVARMNDPIRTFFDDWHTTGDDMKNIDRIL